jgi:hypothetical protein
VDRDKPPAQPPLPSLAELRNQYDAEVDRRRRATAPPRAITRAALTQWAEENDTALVFFDPPAHFDHAIVGLVRGFGQELAVLYDEDKVLAAMEADGDMTPDEVADWFYFNTIGAYVGEATPRFLLRPWEDDDDEQETTDVQET